MKKIIYILLIAAIFASCNQGANNSNDQLAKNKAGMQRFLDEVLNKHNPAMIDSFIAADFTEHQLPPGAKTPFTRDDLKKFMTDYFAGFPDITTKLNFMIADSDMVMVHCTVTGTNSGPFMGMPPTGKKVNYDEVDIVRFNKDGKGIEHWGYLEEMKMATQMGMMPDMDAMMHPDSAKMKMDKDKKPIDMKKMDKEMPKK